MKKKSIILVCILSLFAVGSAIFLVLFFAKDKLKPLPLPEVTGGERGKLGIDKNINESNIDQYLGRKDSVYRDMRLLVDPGNYEAIGGDSYLSGYIKGFEVVPLPYLMPVDDLPEEVGETYQGRTLFNINSSGEYVANYKESMDILEKYFPKNKYIFLMCGGGGYAGMTKELLINLGWDKNKIYNVGGYWYYEGENNVSVRKLVDEYYEYDFDKVPYHEIEFDKLTKINNQEAKEVKVSLEEKYYNRKNVKDYESLSPDAVYDKYDFSMDEDGSLWEAAEAERLERIKEQAEYINKLANNKESFVMILYEENFCEDDTDTVRNQAIKFKEKEKVYMYEVDLQVFKLTNYYKDVRYSPSVIIIDKGKINIFTDAESDEDLIYGSSYEEFSKWFKKHITMP